MKKNMCVLILPAIMLTGCGGGGGGGGGGGVGGGAPALVRTSITSTVTPPAAPTSGPVAANADVLVPPNSSGAWPTIVQGADYTFDQAQAAATRPANPADPFAVSAWRDALTPITVNVQAVNTQNSITTITTGAPFPTDPALGQPVALTNPLLPAATPTAMIMYGYVLPYSPTLNPTGYSYQVYGSWEIVNTTTGATSENYFSAGAPTVAATLPASGTATYSGDTVGSYVNAATGQWSDTYAMLNATANFATLSVAFSTSSTFAVARNAPAGTAPTASIGLNMNGTLRYAPGSNTFTGTVTTANGMSGNATGRFYGPGIAVATPTKAAGAPPEIGGTFAVAGNGGMMQGVFAGK